MGMSLTSLFPSISLEKTSQPGLRVSQTTSQLLHNPPHCPVVFLCLWTHRVSACLLAMKGIPRKTLPLIDCPPLSLLTLPCSQLLVFLMCSPVAALKSSRHSLDLDHGFQKAGLQPIMCCRANGSPHDKSLICFHMSGPRGEGGNFSFRSQPVNV